MSTSRSKRVITVKALAHEPAGRKKAKAFEDVFFDSMARHGDQDEFLLGRFLDDRNCAVIDPKSKDLVLPSPLMKSMPEIYAYPLQPGIQFIAEFSVDKQKYPCELVMVAKSEEEASSKEKWLKKIEQANLKAEKARSAKEDKNRKTEAANSLLAVNGARSPWKSRTVLAPKPIVVPEEDELTDDDEVLPIEPVMALNPPVPDTVNKASVLGGQRHDGQTSASSLVPVLPAPVLSASPKRARLTVLRYPYEISAVDGIQKVVLVPKFSGIRIYVDEAVLAFCRKLENRTTTGNLVTAYMDALIGGEEGVKKLWRGYQEKLAVAKPRKDGTKRAGMKDILGEVFVKCFKLFLDGEGYNTTRGEWVSRAMNRWKRRYFLRYGYITAEEAAAEARNEK